GGVRKKSLRELYPWFPYYVKAFGGTQAWCSWSRRSAPFKAFLQETVNVAREIEKGHKAGWDTTLSEDCRTNARETFKEYILPFIKEHP
ncbi:MAG: hypothetical protein D3906_14635, partial [Candidatus Electrothrix sp. AUS1_2]|nr:hypothetical protein [Candidatus Electrothrix sp. AUS1_2]